MNRFTRCFRSLLRVATHAHRLLHAAPDRQPESRKPLSEDSQILVPQSFIDLYVPPGRTRPTASREHIAARHEVCEDLAQALTERARLVLWQTGITEQDVIHRMQQGLRSPDSGLEEAEAYWVVRRLVELLEWRDVVLAAE